MKVDPRIVNEATAFFNLGKQEYLKHGNSINTEEDAYTFIPIIVNLAFSIELFLKSMLDSHWGHDLEKLFMQIDDNEINWLLRTGDIFTREEKMQIYSFFCLLLLHYIIFFQW